MKACWRRRRASSPRAAARPFGLRGMTPTSASNRDPACDRSLDMAQQPIAIAGSKGLPVFKTPKHSTNRFRIAATTICLGLRRPRDFNRVISATIAGLYRMADGPACIVQREERRCQSWRYVSLDRQRFPTDAAAGSIPPGNHLAARVQYIRTRQFGQHDASQSITDATDA